MPETSFRTGVSAYALAGKPGRRHGTASWSPVDSGQAVTLVHFPLGTRIPSEATILSAHLRMWQVGSDWSGSTTLTAQRVGSWKASRLNWNNQPAVSGVAVTDTQSGTSNKDMWEWDVTADVVAFAAGTVANYGWKITSSSTARRYLRSFRAGNLKPELVVEYATKPAVPTDLKPSGAAVGTTLPTLTFQTNALDALQVQVATDEDFTSIVHDSGTYATTVPRYDLAATAYAGNSGTAYWRAKAALSSQWSDWSQVASWPYAVPPVVTITSDDETADPSPLTQWTAPDQVSRRVRYTRTATGQLLDDSGWATTDELTYAPDFTTGAPGQYTREVWVRDDIERVAVPGFPDYGVATQVYTYTRAAGIAAATSLSVQQVGAMPRLQLTWTRTESPDEWMVLRDGDEIARVDAVDTVQADTLTHVWDDWTATVNREHLYSVLPIVNDEVGDTGPEVLASLHVGPVWLVDPETGEGVPLVEVGDVDLGGRETSSVFETASGDVIRWVHQWYGATGVVEGVVTDLPDFPAEDSEALLRRWRKDAPDSLRLVVAPANVEVQVGDIGVGVSRLDSRQRQVTPVDFTFWAADEGD